MVAPNIGIVGAGVVGTAASAFFGSASVVYDTKPGAPHDRDAINACDAAFVCVPTPMSDDGTCDVSIVESVVEWIESPLIIIRSTVSPGISCHSLCIGWSFRESTVIGVNVPGPTCSVSDARRTPASSKRRMISGVKCSDAVGAATAPIFSA